MCGFVAVERGTGITGRSARGARKRQNGANEAATRATIATLRSAIVVYELKLGIPPATLEELVRVGDADWPGPFLDTDSVPRDAWGREFTYEIKNKRPRVTSAGPDGEFDTADDLWH